MFNRYLIDDLYDHDDNDNDGNNSDDSMHNLNILVCFCRIALQNVTFDTVALCMLHLPFIQVTLTSDFSNNKIVFMSCYRDEFNAWSRLSQETIYQFLSQWTNQS